MEKAGGLMQWKNESYFSGFLISQSFLNELLDDLNKLTGWPEKVKLMQKNWIGKSFGCEIDFLIPSLLKKLRILLRDLTQFLERVSLQFLLIMKYQRFSKDNEFLKFKEECSKQAQLRNLLLRPKK